MKQEQEKYDGNIASGRVPYITKKGEQQYKPVVTGAGMSQIFVGRDILGWCLACGQEVDGVEPDAEKYLCENCHRLKVFGFEQLVLMGLVVTT